MKRFLFPAALLFTALAARGGESAYQALRTFGNERGQSELNRVLQVEGRGGVPQPAVWKISIDDPAARGGVRIVELSKGKIISELTPIKSLPGRPVVMDFGKLNLDSEGAFTVAETEARDARIGFDSVDYLLRADEDRQSPVWVLKLLDTRKQVVGTIHVGANDGVVRRREGFNARTTSGTPPRRTVEVESRTNRDEPDGRGIVHTIDKKFHRVGAKFEKFFTGRRTIDRRFRDEE